MSQEKLEFENIIWAEAERATVGKPSKDRWIKKLLQDTKCEDISYTLSGDSICLLVPIEGGPNNGGWIEVIDCKIQRFGTLYSEQDRREILSNDSSCEEDFILEKQEKSEHQKMFDFFFKK